MTNLTNKKVIVIGGSSGIGWAVARLAYEQQAIVTLTSRNYDKAIAAADNIGKGITAAALDVNDEQGIDEFFSQLSSIDHIYIAAGSTKLSGIMDGSVEDNMKHFNGRILGSLRIVRAAVSRVNPSGSFTFTGGISTDRPIAGAWVSGLATASAEQLARVLVMECKGIRFNAVSPGYTDTAMWDDILGEQKKGILEAVAQSLPVKKIATAEEVASAVIFLMSNASVTGEVIHVDGGGRLV